MKYSAAYHAAHKMQNVMYAKAIDPKMEGTQSTAFVAKWLELEWFKRELRGLPRLKSSDLIANLRSARARRIASAAPSVPIEVESIPAEPPPSAPSDQ